MDKSELKVVNAINWLDKPISERPAKMPPHPGHSCEASQKVGTNSFFCTLPKDHKGKHIGDGTKWRCGEWDYEDASGRRMSEVE